MKIPNIQKEDIKEKLKAAKDGAQKLAETVKDAAVETRTDVKEKIDQAKYEADLKRYRPVFSVDVRAPEFQFPNIIQIVDEDEKPNVPACVDSIGCLKNVNGTEVLNIYEGEEKKFGIKLYPDSFGRIYYVNPFLSQTYLSLDDYFSQMQKARVLELENLAKDLGAKHVTITLKEEKKTLVSNDVKVKANAANGRQAKGSAQAEHEEKEKEYASVDVLCDTSFSGHDMPKKPVLVYFKNDPDIINLVKTRMSSENENKIYSKSYSIDYKKSSGIKIKDAIKIDGVLDKLKLGGTASVASEAQRESRIVLVYSIEF